MHNFHTAKIYRLSGGSATDWAGGGLSYCRSTTINESLSLKFRFIYQSLNLRNKLKNHKTFLKITCFSSPAIAMDPLSTRLTYGASVSLNLKVLYKSVITIMLGKKNG